jgi:hypothetical protein
MRGIRSNLVFWILTSLPSSLGLLAFPLRIISVWGSNTLTIFPGEFVSHAKIGILVCLTTCRTRPTMVSSQLRTDNQIVDEMVAVLGFSGEEYGSSETFYPPLRAGGNEHSLPLSNDQTV